MIDQILWTACVTPFTADGQAVDYDSLAALVHNQAKAGNGVLILGSTGESLALTAKEKREVVSFVCGLQSGAPLMVGLPGIDLPAVLEFIEFCNDMPVAGYLVTTPMYAKPGIMGQTKWFETVLDRLNKPAMLYNIPGRAGVALHPQAVANLRDHPRFKAIKDSGGTLDYITAYKKAAPEIAVYCGDDNMMPEMAAAGASGLVSVASNAWGAQVRQYVLDCLAGKCGDAQAQLWRDSGKVLFCASNPVPVKALLKHIGLITHDTMRLPLTQDDFHGHRELFAFHERVA